MYVGPLYDFFYKPKEWILQQPKFDYKNDNFMNINGKIYKFNALTGDMILSNTIPKQTNFRKDSNKLKKYKSKKNINIYSNKFVTKNNILSPNNSNNNEQSNQSPISIDKESNLDNSNKYLKTIENENNNKHRIPSKINNIKYLSNSKTIDKSIYSKTFNATNSYMNSLKITKKYNSIMNEKNRQNKTNAYFNKKTRKYFKPSIAFGHKILKPLSTENNIGNNKKKNENKFKNTNYQNTLYLMYRQHSNNITGEGTTNDKIYEKNNDDNIIFKEYRDQIFKERITNNLKKKYNFYVDDNNNETELKVPHITHKNFYFYRGYSFSDKRKKIPIHQKLFFKYINKYKSKEKKEDLF
jgi:hypothetical protein